MGAVDADAANGEGTARANGDAGVFVPLAGTPGSAGTGGETPTAVAAGGMAMLPPPAAVAVVPVGATAC